MFRYEKHDDIQKLTMYHRSRHSFVFQVTNVLGGKERLMSEVKDKDSSTRPNGFNTHTSQRTGGEMFPVSQTELLPVVSENAQKTQKNTEKSPKKVQETECGIIFSPLSLFFSR